MTLDRLVWFHVPADQRTGRNLWISRWQIAVTAVILEIVCFIFTFTGGVIFVLELTGYDQPAAVTGYRLMMFSFILQHAGRIYLVASSLRLAHTIKTGIANDKAGSWDTGTVFNLLTITGLSLTVRALLCRHGRIRKLTSLTVSCFVQSDCGCEQGEAAHMDAVRI